MAFGRPLLIVLASLVDPSLADVKASDRQPIDASDPPHCDRASSCPSYGCPLLPRDVIYDKEANAALEVLFGKGENDNDDEYPNTARVMQELESSGSEDAVTLTLVGYKGGRLEDQINQECSSNQPRRRRGAGRLAASFIRLARAAPVKPGVRRAMLSRDSSSSSFLLRQCTSRMARRPLMSGASTVT